jgi:hypothetical protein
MKTRKIARGLMTAKREETTLVLVGTHSRVPRTAKWGRRPMVGPRSFSDTRRQKETSMEHEPRSRRRTAPTSRSFVSPKTYNRDPGAKTTVVAILSVTGASLFAAALIFEFAVDPPALGWIWYAIVSIIVLGLGALAPLAFERTRVSAQRPAVASDREPRLLVIADSRCNEAVLCDEILARLAGAVAARLVVPVRVSHLHFLTDDESEERRQAETSMSISVELLHQRGVSTTGSVGSDKPLESMTDALGSFPATRVLLATPPEEESYWLERGLLPKAGALTRVPVEHVVVPTTPAGRPRSEGRRPGSQGWISPRLMA